MPFPAEKESPVLDEVQGGVDDFDPDDPNLDDVILEGFEDRRAPLDYYSSEQRETPEGEGQGEADEVTVEGEETGGKKPPTEEKKPAVDEDTPVIRSMRGTIKALQKEVKQLQSEREESEKAKAEPPLTREQLLTIYREHADDPEVAMNIMQYMVQQGVTDSKKATTEIAEQEKIGNVADTYFGSLFPSYGDEEFVSKLDEDFPLEKWGLKGHPHARRIQTAMVVAANLKPFVDKEVKAALEKSKVSTKKDEVRVDMSRGGPLPKTSKSGPTAPDLDARAAVVARELGLSAGAKKIYAGFLPKKG